jgi:dTMP kinase
MYDALVAADVPVHLTQEPSFGPVGSLIRQVIQRRLVSIGASGPRKPSWDTMGLLFAADRLDHLECEIEPNLEDGIHVVTDRYIHSSIVYQSVTAERVEVVEWLEKINEHARPPDIVFYLEVHPELAHRRRMERQTMTEMYDDPELQEKLAQGYEKLFGGLAGVNVVRIDGSLPEDGVHAACMAALKDVGIP